MQLKFKKFSCFFLFAIKICVKNIKLCVKISEIVYPFYSSQIVFETLKISADKIFKKNYLIKITIRKKAINIFKITDKNLSLFFLSQKCFKILLQIIISLINFIYNSWKAKH